ncbi:MAG: hypothetical protein U5K54_00040 [Cytophagales bacterium]|nr:hypothetical protein [Cytophagales bacterium]
MANNLGVLSFNGNQWQTQASNTGKKQRSLAFDDQIPTAFMLVRKGSLVFLKVIGNYVSLVEKIPQDLRDFDEVWDVFIFDSKVFFCTFKAIYIYDGDQRFHHRASGGFNQFIFGGQ